MKRGHLHNFIFQTNLRIPLYRYLYSHPLPWLRILFRIYHTEICSSILRTSLTLHWFRLCSSHSNWTDPFVIYSYRPIFRTLYPCWEHRYPHLLHNSPQTCFRHSQSSVDHPLSSSYYTQFASHYTIHNLLQCTPYFFIILSASYFREIRNCYLLFFRENLHSII